MTETEKNNLIYEEYERISSYYVDLSEGQAAIIYPLIKSAAVMRMALEDLAEFFIKEGTVEAYQNGEHQKGLKQSAALQAYNSTVKNYAGVIKQLYGLLPREKRPTVSEVFTPRQKTPEEWNEEIRKDTERAARINAEIAAAAEKQRRDRETQKKEYDNGNI